MSHVFLQKTQVYRDRVDQTLDDWLSDQSSVIAPDLLRAMRYSVLNGGKRVRPVLLYSTELALRSASNLSEKNADVAAAAIECIHAYSLIHDDLPAMDDDDLRRGKPTCHIQFDEATAILAGDALLTLAFEKLSTEIDDARLAVQLIRELSLSSGSSGMVAGQMLDIQAEGQGDGVALPALEQIHKHKTGALIRASVRMGALLADASEDQMTALSEYADAIGLAFQVQDDIIDVVSDTETLGKPQGADIELGKSTYVSLLGLCGAQEKAESLVMNAKRVLASLAMNDSLLDKMSDYIIDRRN